MPQRRSKPRPHRWLHKDPDIHKKYRPFLSHKTQSEFHGQPWNLSFEQWLSLWTEENWQQRGRAGDKLCMRRIDLDLPWQLGNVELVRRRDMVKLAHLRRVQLFQENNCDLADTSN